MTMLPHRAIHLIALGREAGQRHKNTVWLCAGCRTGATQCPDAVDIPGIVDLWQQLSGVPEIHIMAIEWEESVAEIVRQFGNGVGSAAA